MNFSNVWERIQREAKIKNISQLAEIVGKTHQTISAKKAQGKEFPIEWAYLVAKKYNLSTDWILTGKGDKHVEGKIEPSKKIIIRLEKWLENLTAKDPRKEIWFECEIERHFPEFKEWDEQQNEKKDQKAA
ncbi:MAG: helix-turn-helix domain-containing protein [Candidatus Electrothrix scaldis]|nr:MAG: helix-turn-helix domain-containing protein [Candidatus Electrothrix sp. GW3-3]